MLATGLQISICKLVSVISVTLLTILADDNSCSTVDVHYQQPYVRNLIRLLTIQRQQVSTQITVSSPILLFVYNSWLNGLVFSFSLFSLRFIFSFCHHLALDRSYISSI